MKEFRMTSIHTGGAPLTGNGPIALAIRRENAYGLAEMRLTLGAPAADLSSFALRLDAENGPAFDHILAAPDPNEDLAVVTSFRYADPVPPAIFPGDSVSITWPNAGGVVWAIDIIGSM